MKKKFIMTIILIFTIVIVGCGIGPIDNGEGEGPTTASDYFPVEENIFYSFEGYGNEYASYDVYIDYVEGGKIQQRINNGGTELAVVLKIEKDKVTKIFTRGESYFRQNFLDYKSTGPVEVVLMGPIEIGASWSSGNDSVSTITNISADIETPLGDYEALEVTTEDSYGKSKNYYVKGLGLVKNVYIGEGYEVSSALVAIEKNIPFVQRVRFYYPNIDDETYYYKDIKIGFMTNDITRELLAKNYKGPIEGGNPKIGEVLTENTLINSLYLNDDGMVYIDLNRAFLTEMNAGAGYEGMILQSLANTFGEYYNSDKVIITIENELYESGHIAFEKGEFITVNTYNSKEIKQ